MHLFVLFSCPCSLPSQSSRPYSKPSRQTATVNLNFTITHRRRISCLTVTVADNSCSQRGYDTTQTITDNHTGTKIYISFFLYHFLPAPSFSLPFYSYSNQIPLPPSGGKS